MTNSFRQRGSAVHPRYFRSPLCPFAILGLVLALAPGVAAACACGCGVFEVGTGAMFPGGSGGMAFAEYDFMNQNRNWSGTSRAPATDNEDKRIRTDFITMGVQYMFTRTWGVQAELPYWRRSFTTTDSSDNVVTFDHADFGDVRIKGIYTGFSEDMSTGITFGLKLPSGDSSFPNFDPDTQIGTGSVDVLLGAYHLGRFGTESHWNWFMEGAISQEVAHRKIYRPGTEVNAVTGVYYAGWSIGTAAKVAPVVQINASYRGHDGGLEGDPDNSGYVRGFVTPGVEVTLSRVKIYTSVSLPFWQHVNGNQLVGYPLYKINVSYGF